MQRAGAQSAVCRQSDRPPLILGVSRILIIETEPGSGGSAMNFTLECEQEDDGRWIAEAPELVPIC
jgi:hypothetical protein